MARTLPSQPPTAAVGKHENADDYSLPHTPADAADAESPSLTPPSAEATSEAISSRPPAWTAAETRA